MKCPTCCGPELVHQTRDVSFTHEGETVTVPNLTGDHCPACGEIVMDGTEARRFNSIILDLGFSAWLDAPGLTYEYLEYKARPKPEPKKRGRKPKAPVEAPPLAAAAVGVVVDAPKPSDGTGTNGQLRLI